VLIKNVSFWLASLLTLSFPAYSAPVTNPASPTLIQEGLFIADTFWCQPRASFSQDFTSTRQLHSSSAHNITTSSYTSLASATWSIRERFDLSLILGSAENYFRMYQDNQLLEFRPSGGLIWYGEGKLILLEVRDTILSIFGEAGGWDWMSGPAYVNQRPQKNDANLKMRFWQAGVSLTQQIGLFSPYLGVAVLRSRWKLTEPSQTFRFHQKYTAGPLLGCALCTTSKISLNIEWRGMIENAYTVSGELRF